MNKLGLTTGFSFRPSEKVSIDCAFTYVTGFGRNGSYTDQFMLLKGLPIPESEKERVFEGHYDAHAFIPSIGISNACRFGYDLINLIAVMLIQITGPFCFLNFDVYLIIHRN